MRNRIAYKLAAIWLAVALPLVAILVASSIERYGTQISLIQQQRLGYARLSATAFRSLVSGAQRTMLAMGTHTHTLNARDLRRTAAVYPATYVALTDLNGRVTVASDERLVGSDFSGLEAYQMAESAPGGGGIEPSSKVGDEAPGVNIAQRIRAPDNRVVGTMVMRLDVARLQKEYPLEVPTGGISIIDSAGQVVYQNENPTFALVQDQWGERYPFIRRALEGRDSLTREFDFPTGGPRIGAFVPVEPYGWAAGSSVPASEALAPYWKSIMVTLPLSLGIAALGFFVSLAISNRILNALDNLRRDAETIGGGEFTRPVSITRGDEIGIVARALEKSRQGLLRYEEENQRLFRQQQEVSDLNAALASISDTMHSTLDFQEALTRVIEAAASALGCEAAGVNLRSQGEWERVALYGLPEEYLGERLTDEQNTVAALVRSTQQPVIVSDTTSDSRISSWFAERYGIKSVMAFPLMQRGDVFGVVFFNYLSSAEEFTPAQIDFATNMANSLSLAYENARLYEAEHDVAEKLQSALLEVPSEIEGVDFAVRYNSASDTARVGGDFYDIFPLSKGCVGVTVGDISGHGVDAAVLTTLVKTAIRVRAYEPGATPDEALSIANRVLYEDTGAETFATITFALIDIDESVLAYSSGGHTTGAIIRGSEVVPLPANSPLVGAFEGAAFSESEVPFEAGEVLFLYTDGLIEARRNGDFYGEERLFALLSELDSDDPAVIAQHVFDDVLQYSESRLADDVAILALRRTRT